MDQEILAAGLWLLLSVVGVIVSVRAFVRAARRLPRSRDEVARAVHLAELITGALFFVVFAIDVSTVVTSLVILPPLEGATEVADAYSRFRTAVVRWQLVGAQGVSLLVVFVPEILDRHLTRLALRRDDGHPSEIGRD